jgi:hypothetical protein
MSELGAAFEALVRADAEDPGLPAARTAFVYALAKGFRGPLFEPRKAVLAAAAVRCGPALAERVTREALHAVAEASTTQPGPLSRPLAALVLQAAREAHSGPGAEPGAGCGHGGFADPLIGEQLAAFLPQHLGSLDPRVVFGSPLPAPSVCELLVCAQLSMRTVDAPSAHNQRVITFVVCLK